MSDTNQVQLAIAPEATFNVHPGAGAAWSSLRFQSESLKPNLALASSDEIRGYRDIPALNATDKGNSGAINQSVYFDDNGLGQIMRHGLGSGAWSSEVEVDAATLCTITGSDNTITRATSVWTNLPSVGGWIYVSGSTVAANNGFHKIVSGTTSTIVVPDYLVDDAAVALTIIELSQITNGNTFQSFAIERTYTDLSNICEQFMGCGINGFSVDASGQGVAKFSSDWLGVDSGSDAAAETIDNAFSTTPEMTTTNGIQWLREGKTSAMADLSVLGFGFSVAGNLRKQYELSRFGAKGIKFGDFIVTGTLRAYFANSTLIDKFMAMGETALAMAISDEVTARGNTYLFDFPAVRFTDAQRVAGGRNDDIIVDMPWQAIYDGTSHTMKVCKLASA